EAMKKALKGVDRIVHLAAETGTGQSMYEIEKYFSVNVQGTAKRTVSGSRTPSLSR
ncbi:MAG: hypothetical protein D3905_09670, partial [Candidatus Electrothrix sp. AS4_5]|nr:hypothetical protein [Candidatus Electrothrix gigas]